VLNRPHKRFLDGIVSKFTITEDPVRNPKKLRVSLPIQRLERHDRHTVRVVLSRHQWSQSYRRRTDPDRLLAATTRGPSVRGLI
jgi:hypothetical protein